MHLNIRDNNCAEAKSSEYDTRSDVYSALLLAFQLLQCIAQHVRLSVRVLHLQLGELDQTAFDGNDAALFEGLQVQGA